MFPRSSFEAETRGMSRRGLIKEGGWYQVTLIRQRQVWGRGRPKAWHFRASERLLWVCVRQCTWAQACRVRVCSYTGKNAGRPNRLDLVGHTKMFFV